MTCSRLREIVQRYARSGPDQLTVLLEKGLAADPHCPVTRYLLGCQCFDRGRMATGVRHFMAAHHIEPDFQSAALLVFAGLNWVTRRHQPLLPVLLDTWDEFRRPTFDERAKERLLLDAFSEPPPDLLHGPELARRLWRLPIRVLRSQIRAAVGSQDTRLYPLLCASA